MSHIFDALQRSEAEGTGFSFPTASNLVGERGNSPQPEVTAQERARIDFGQCPSVRVSLQPNSRLVSFANQGCLASEKFCLLAVRLRQIQHGRALKKILITSTVPEEGKSLICANLAAAFAHKNHQRILLLDGDLRRPA